MKSLAIADTLALPLDAQTSTTVIYGGKGMGKTNLGSVLVEEFARAHLRFAVIDPMGTAIAQHVDGVKRDQLSVLAGYKKRSRDTYVSRLRGAGFVDLDGNRIVATAAGVAALGPNFERLPTGERLREYWMQRLPEGERRVLAPILSAYPGEIHRDAIVVGYKKRSRDTYLSRLAARQLITIVGPGQVRAADILF